MSNESVGFSEDRSLGPREGAKSGQRSPGLEFFRLNPFRTLRAPIRIPSQEALWKSEKVLSRLRAGLEAPEPDLAPWLAAPDEFEIREGAQKMEEPLRRLREQLLWFDFTLDPRGAFLEQALSSHSATKLREYLAAEEDVQSLAAGASPMNRIAHRVNQANLRVLLGLSALHGSDLIARAEVPRSVTPVPLKWKDIGGLSAAMNPHLALASALEKHKTKPKQSLLGDGLARWGALLKDPAFTSYVQAEIESLGDDLVGGDDVETLTYAVSSALADIVLGEARLQMSRGSTGPVFELTNFALKSGIDPVFWTTAFKPLRIAFQAELAELDVLLDGRPRVKDVDLYLSRIESLVEPWARVRDSGVLGLDQVVDSAVIVAIEAVRRLEHPAVVLGQVSKVLERAEAIARSESTKERARECSADLQRYGSNLCNYCSKRDAQMERSVVLSGKKVLRVERVGYNATRTTYGMVSALVPRCATCAELHEWLFNLVRTVWTALVVGAPFVLGALGDLIGGAGVFFGSIAFLGGGFAGTRGVAMIVTARRETGYWAYKRTEGYRRMAREGYSVFAHNYSKNAFARLKKQGPQSPAGTGRHSTG